MGYSRASPKRARRSAPSPRAPTGRPQQQWATFPGTADLPRPILGRTGKRRRALGVPECRSTREHATRHACAPSWSTCRTAECPSHLGLGPRTLTGFRSLPVTGTTAFAHHQPRTLDLHLEGRDPHHHRIHKHGAHQPGGLSTLILKGETHTRPLRTATIDRAHR